MLCRRLLGLAFFVAALAACGEKGASPSSGGDRSPPEAPAAVVAEAAVRNARVSWTAPSSDGGSAILSYTVKAVPGDATATTEDTEITIEGLSDGTTYTFVVRAMNAAGAGPWSEPSSPVTTFDKPGAPTGVVGFPGDREVSLTWTAPVVDGGSPVTGYEVEIAPGVGSASVAVVGTSATVGGLENGVAYTFQVRALSEVGPGPWSEPSAAVTPVGGSVGVVRALLFSIAAPAQGIPVGGISLEFALPEGVSISTVEGSGKISPAALRAAPAVPGTTVVMGSFDGPSRKVKLALAATPEGRWSGDALRLALDVAEGKALGDADLAAIRSSVGAYKVVGFDETTESSVILTHLVETSIAFAAD